MIKLLLKILIIIFLCLFLNQNDYCKEKQNTKTKQEKIVKAVFGGCYRRTAKTSFFKQDNFPQFEEFDNIDSLLNNLPEDDEIINKYPSITTKCNSRYNIDNDMPRNKEENRNVQINECWLYAINLEGDNDLHIIIGNTKNATSKTKYMNVEITALPKEKTLDINLIQQIRKEVLKDFQYIKKGYVENLPHLKVKVNGSVLFDGDHEVGTIGYGKYKSKTHWEIHPIYSIEVLNSNKPL